MSDVKGPWTDEEISTLVSMWPNATALQIAARLHRSHSGVRDQIKRLRKTGLWEAKTRQLRKKSLLEAKALREADQLDHPTRKSSTK